MFMALYQIKSLVHIKHQPHCISCLHECDSSGEINITYFC